MLGGWICQLIILGEIPATDSHFCCAVDSLYRMSLTHSCIDAGDMKERQPGPCDLPGSGNSSSNGNTNCGQPRLLAIVVVRSLLLLVIIAHYGCTPRLKFHRDLCYFGI